MDPVPLPPESFQAPVLEVARALLGQLLLKDGVGGLIVETEAYHEQEPASHSHRGQTRRNRSMFLPGGHLYVYRIHQSVCANVVTGPAGVGAAVLIRALLPRAGRERIAHRRRGIAEAAWTDGPGKLCAALAVTLADDGLDLTRPGPVQLLDTGWRAPRRGLLTGPRVGISRARELPWRFQLAPRQLAALRERPLTVP